MQVADCLADAIVHAIEPSTMVVNSDGTQQFLFAQNFHQPFIQIHTMSSNVFLNTGRRSRLGPDEEELYVHKKFDSNCRPQCRPKCDPCKSYDQCDPCGGSGRWFGAAVLVFIIVGIGLWAIRPYWIVNNNAALGAAALNATDPATAAALAGCSSSIDWLKLFAWDLFITFILLILAWFLKLIWSNSFGYGCF